MDGADKISRVQSTITKVYSQFIPTIGFTGTASDESWVFHKVTFRELQNSDERRAKKNIVKDPLLETSECSDAMYHDFLKLSYDEIDEESLESCARCIIYW